jgi:hypothetical protein
VDYQVGQSVCPKCGSSAEVRTARELFDTFNGAREQAFQRLTNRSGGAGFGQSGAPGQNWDNADDDDYDHYNVEGSGSTAGRNQGSNRGSRDFGIGDNLADDIGGAVFGAALGFAGRAIGRRMKKAFEEKVVPAMEARAAQAQQQFEQSKATESAIVERYPELRSCTKDQVVFLDGGYRTVPVSELKMPITMEQADAVVAQLR